MILVHLFDSHKPCTVDSNFFSCCLLRVNFTTILPIPRQIPDDRRVTPIQIIPT
jgi:hypothetical protein